MVEEGARVVVEVAVGGREAQGERGVQGVQAGGKAEERGVEKADEGEQVGLVAEVDAVVGEADTAAGEVEEAGWEGRIHRHGEDSTQLPAREAEGAKGEEEEAEAEDAGRGPPGERRGIH